MEKVRQREIRDYLHLYLGCECQTDEGKIGWFSGFDVCERDYSITMITVRFSDKSDDWTVLNDNEECDRIKLILRPLSDMTEDEAVEFIHLKNRSILSNIDRTEITKVSFGSTKNIINFSYFRRQGAGAEGGSKTYYVNQSDSEQFAYMLSRGFDLFRLIEAGLAINKTKSQGEIKTELI